MSGDSTTGPEGRSLLGDTYRDWYWRNRIFEIQLKYFERVFGKETVDEFRETLRETPKEKLLLLVQQYDPKDRSEL